MTILAGLYAPGGWTAQDQRLADEIRTQISRTETDVPAVFFDEALFACKVDIGAFGEPAWHEDADWFATLTGRPLLGGADRGADLRSLCVADPGRVIGLGGHGAFCALVYAKASRELRLLTDPLGLRPFYVCEIDGRWLFSTSLRVIAGLSIDLALDLHGISEAATLGYFLLDHSPYHGVLGAPPGADWTFDAEGIAAGCYVPWKDLERPASDLEPGLAGVHAAFEGAVTAYLAGGNGRELVNLSGSLNSRLIAAALKRRGVQLHGLASTAADPVARYCTTTFADANLIPLTLVETPVPLGCTEERVAIVLEGQGATPASAVARPRTVWTGKGGAIGTSLFALDETDVELARWGNATRLADRHIARAQIALPPRIICNYSVLEDGIRTALIAALGAMPGLSQAHALALFLSIQHQRRHLVLQREDIDRHRVELNLPLSSPRLAWAVLALNSESMREHSAYRALIERHYPEVMATPWRSSPGQLVCPLAIPPAAGRLRPWRRSGPVRRALIARSWRVLREWPLPPGVMDRRGFAITLALTASRLREGIYSLKLADGFTRWM